jgi:hypothetical protein
MPSRAAAGRAATRARPSRRGARPGDGIERQPAELRVDEVELQERAVVGELRALGDRAREVAQR